MTYSLSYEHYETIFCHVLGRRFYIVTDIFLEKEVADLQIVYTSESNFWLTLLSKRPTTPTAPELRVDCLSDANMLPRYY